MIVLGKVFICFHNRPSTQHQQTTFTSGILLVFWSWCPADVSTFLHCLPLFWSQFRWNKTHLSCNALPTCLRSSRLSTTFWCWIWKESRITRNGSYRVHVTECTQSARSCWTMGWRVGPMLEHVGPQDPEGLRVFYYLVQDAICTKHCTSRGMSWGHGWTWWHVLLKHLEISWIYVVLLMFILFPFSSFLIFWLCWSYLWRIWNVSSSAWFVCTSESSQSEGTACDIIIRGAMATDANCSDCSHSRLKIVPEAVKMLQQLN